MSLFSRLLSPAYRVGGGEDAGLEADGPQPERLTYVVGDVHGCRTELDHLLDQIAEDCAGQPADLVFLGDYIDRGPNSAGVLRRLHAMQQAAPTSVTCLLGNHERMMLDFLQAPLGAGQRWLHMGGMETLESFDIPHYDTLNVTARSKAWSDALRDALGAEVIRWLSGCPLWWRSGSLIAVHALTEPGRAMEAQREQVLLWARPRSNQTGRRDGAWVVHGHTMVEAPRSAARHIAIDTGAGRGGALTAAVLGDGPVRYLQAGPSWSHGIAAQ